MWPLITEQQETLDKMAEVERKKLKDIRLKLQKRVEAFAADDGLKKLQLEPMDHTVRAIL